jgi:hypothetical protein
MVDRLDAVVGAIFDDFHAVPRDVPGLFAFALFQQFSYLSDALVRRVFIGLDATIGEVIDRIGASLGNLFRIGLVGGVGSLRGGQLLTGQDHEGCHRQESKSLNSHDLPLFSVIGVGVELNEW